jgi:hypothetical protein
MPMVVAVNRVDGVLSHNLDDVRWAPAIDDDTPLMTFDARDRASVCDAVLALLRRSLARVS